MPNDALEGARAKLDRAKHHLEQLEAELAGLLRDLDEDKLRVVRDLARSLRGSAKRR